MQIAPKENIGTSRVDYVLYPNGTVDIHVRCSDNPLKLETETDRSMIIERQIIDLEGLRFIEQMYVGNRQNAQGGKWEMCKTQISYILCMTLTSEYNAICIDTEGNSQLRLVAIASLGSVYFVAYLIPDSHMSFLLFKSSMIQICSKLEIHLFSLSNSILIYK